MHIPPVRTNNQFNALSVFYIPLSFIRKKMVCQFYFKTVNRPGARPSELYAYSGVLDEILTQSIENPNNPIRQIKMTVDAAKGQPVNSALAKIDLTLDMSAFLLDSSTLQKIQGKADPNMGLSIG